MSLSQQIPCSAVPERRGLWLGLFSQMRHRLNTLHCLLLLINYIGSNRCSSKPLSLGSETKEKISQEERFPLVYHLTPPGHGLKASELVVNVCILCNLGGDFIYNLGIQKEKKNKVSSGRLKSGIWCICPLEDLRGISHTPITTLKESH